jgi:hypothetical protein
MTSTIPAIEIESQPIEIDKPKPSKKDVLDMLKNMIEIYDKIPPYAMHAPVSNADLLSVLLLMQAIATADS